MSRFTVQEARDFLHDALDKAGVEDRYGNIVRNLESLIDIKIKKALEDAQVVGDKIWDGS